MNKNVLEPFLGSLGILLAGVFTIPFAGSISGVNIDYYQAIKMSVLFFIGRFLWLYFLRKVYDSNRYVK